MGATKCILNQNDSVDFYLQAKRNNQLFYFIYIRSIPLLVFVISIIISVSVPIYFLPYSCIGIYFYLGCFEYLSLLPSEFIQVHTQLVPLSSFSWMLFSWQIYYFLGILLHLLFLISIFFFQFSWVQFGVWDGGGAEGKRFCMGLQKTEDVFVEVWVVNVQALISYQMQCFFQCFH